MPFPDLDAGLDLDVDGVFHIFPQQRRFNKLYRSPVVRAFWVNRGSGAGAPSESYLLLSKIQRLCRVVATAGVRLRSDLIVMIVRARKDRRSNQRTRH